MRYRDHLIARGLVGSSVGRVISSIRAVFNFAIFEYALDLKNPFVGMYFDKSAGVSKRLPIPIEDIRKVQHLFRTIDDESNMAGGFGLRYGYALGRRRWAAQERYSPRVKHTSYNPQTASMEASQDLWQSTRYPACRDFSMGRSEALRVLSRQSLCFS